MENELETKPNLDEMKRVLKEDYTKNAQRLKQIPDDIGQLKLNLDMTREDCKLKSDSINFVIEDFEIRIKNFSVLDPKFEWETKPEWHDNQKKILNLEIEKAKFNLRMVTKNLSSNELNTQLQLDDVEKQRKRCIDAHKVVLKRLIEECKLSPSEFSELKKNCTSECCR